MKKAALRKGKIALLLIVAMLLCDIPVTSHATSTQNELNEALEEREEIKNKLDEQQEQLDELKDVESDLQKELKKLNKELTEVSDNLAQLELEIADKEREIESTEALLAEAIETENWQYECIVQRIQVMYEQGEMGYLDIVFAGGSFSALLNYQDYFTAVAEYDRKMLDAYKETRELIEEQEALLYKEHSELEEMKLAAEVEKNRVAGLMSQTSTKIEKYSDQIEAAEEAARLYEEELKKQDEDIEALRKKIAEEMALSQAAANATWRDISEVNFADGDRKLLASIIYCEAGGEPYEGQLAVGAVVINRVLSSRYPNTVVGVIYQKSQFSPVASGRLELALAMNKATARCYQAADEAMSGVTNVGNCLYFRTPIAGLTGISIGGHIFY